MEKRKRRTRTRTEMGGKERDRRRMIVLWRRESRISITGRKQLYPEQGSGCLS